MIQICFSTVATILELYLTFPKGNMLVDGGLISFSLSLSFSPFFVAFFFFFIFTLSGSYEES